MSKTAVYVRNRNGDGTLAITTTDGDGKAMSGPTMLGGGEQGTFHVEEGEEVRVVCMAAEVETDGGDDAPTYDPAEVKTEGDDGEKDSAAHEAGA